MKKVRLIIANIKDFADVSLQMLSQIAPGYAAKYEKRKKKEDKLQEVVSGYLLKHYLGVVRDEQLTYNAHKKPYLASGEKYFNLSHSGNYVALAIAECEVGIDMEKSRTCNDAIVKRFFPEQQRETISKLSGKKRDEAFTKIWTQCEAVLKLQGTGLSSDWGQISMENCCLTGLQLGEYYISCATKNEIILESEKFIWNTLF